MDQPDLSSRSETVVGGNSLLEQQVRSLRAVVTMLLLACCCLGAGLALYLYRQVTQVNVQVIEAKRVIGDYQTNALPRIKWFVESLQTYAKTNPDFNPILAKYGLLPTNTPAQFAVPFGGNAAKK